MNFILDKTLLSVEELKLEGDQLLLLLEVLLEVLVGLL